MFDVSVRECRLCLSDVGSCRNDVNPGGFRQAEPLAPERPGEGRSAVKAPLGEQRAQLAHEHCEGILPRRRQGVAPQRLGKLVAWHRPVLLRHEVREQDPTLSAGKALLVDHDAVGLDSDATGKEDLQVQPPKGAFLPTSCLDLVALFYGRGEESWKRYFAVTADSRLVGSTRTTSLPRFSHTRGRRTA